MKGPTYYDLPKDVSRIIWSYIWETKVRYPSFICLFTHPQRKFLLEQQETIMRMP